MGSSSLTYSDGGDTIFLQRYLSLGFVVGGRCTWLGRGRSGLSRWPAEERFPAADASLEIGRGWAQFWIWGSLFPSIFRHFLGFGLADAWLAGRPGIPRSGSAPVQILCEPLFDYRGRGGPESSVATAGGLSAVLERAAVGDSFGIALPALGCLSVLVCTPRGFISGGACLRRRVLFICARATPCRPGSPILDDVRRLGPTWFVRIWGATLAALQNVQSCGGFPVEKQGMGALSKQPNHPGLGGGPERATA